MFGINDIWMLLGIPFVATVYLLVFHMKATKWWELLIIWPVAIISIFVSQIIVERISVSDDEFWGFNGVEAVYDEPFQYWGTCSRTYACGEDCYTDSKGNRSCSTRFCTEYYDCKKWGGDVATLRDQSGGKRHISRARFKQLEREKWANTNTIELNRQKQYRIIKDGDRRVTKWPGTWETAEPIAEMHTYENRTQSSSTMSFLEVTEVDVEKYSLFEYPTFYGGYEVVTVMDASGRNWRKADQYFRYLNGILGFKRRCRVWVLIFRDQPREAMHYQTGYWKNGNKNEFIICIGADKEGNVTWGDVISWTEVEELKIEFRDFVEQQVETVTEDSLGALARYTEEQLAAKYVKPEFTDKFKHLSVQPSTTSMVVTALIILLVTAGVCAWIVFNDINQDGVPSKRRRRTAGRRRRWW